MERRWDTKAAAGGVGGVDSEIVFMKVIALLIVALIIYGLIVTSGSNKKNGKK
jgi:hypothetical protein